MVRYSFSHQSTSTQIRLPGRDNSIPSWTLNKTLMKSGQYLSSSSTQNIKRVHLQFECNIKVVPGPSPDTLNIRELFIYNEHLCSLKTRRQKTECNVLNLRYDLWSYDFEFTFFLSVYQLCSKQSRVQMQTRYWHGHVECLCIAKESCVRNKWSEEQWQIT